MQYFGPGDHVHLVGNDPQLDTAMKASDCGILDWATMSGQ